MERLEILERLTPIVRKAVKNETLELNENLNSNEIEGWDSLAQMLIASEVEKTFLIKFKLREIGMFKTIGNLIDLIEEKIK